MLKDVPIYIANRLIKYFGNVTKHLVGHPYHWVFPQKRFCIPKHAAPLWTSSKATLIPRNVWLTNFTNHVSLPVYLNYLVNRLLAPAHSFHFMDDNDIESFIEKNFSAEIYQDYSCLNDGAAKADYWRLLVLHHHGGIYIDMDAHFVWPLDQILKANDDELYLRISDDQEYSITNYFIASKPGHPHLEKIITAVRDRIQSRMQTTAWALTGPGPMQEALLETTVHTRKSWLVGIQGTFTNEYFQYLDKPNGKWTHTKIEDTMHRPAETKDAA